jgi:hypothetical protein
VTAICAGGTSAPKVGAAAVVDYSAGLIAAIFAAYDLAWLIPVIPLVGLAPLTLSTFCATDPPAVPTFTSAETNALLQLQFGADFDSGLAKVKDLALNAIWYDACQCTAGSPTPLAPPAPPAGTPITQFPVAPTNQPCYSNTFTSVTATGGNTFRGGFVVPAGLAPTAFLYHCVGTPGSGSVPGDFTWEFQQWDSTGATIQTDTFLVATPSQTVDHIVTAKAGVHSVNLQQNANTGNYTQAITGSRIDGYCGTQPGALQQPCCPPDPATQSYLDNILKLVTLIQRQIVPFAYVPGNVHAGLSGAGVLAIHGLLGIKIEITTDPTNLGVEGTSPALLFDRGFFTWGSPDGYPQSERLERTNQLSLPSRASAFTELAYDLHPGVVVTITELVREP